MKNLFKYTLIGLLCYANFACHAQNPFNKNTSENTSKDKIANNSTSEFKDIVLGINNTQAYFSLIKGKKIGVVSNQTGVVSSEKNAKLLVDFLLDNKFDVVKIYSPEHGYRGDADAGENVTNGNDTKSGLPIVSIYGDNKKPSATQLKGIEVLIFDLQDVGARFYTYISTLHYVLEAAAENNIPVIVLDRPNPNAHYVDGPVLKEAYKSFVGMHKVPVVYGMTIGEYGLMINGEKWLANGVKANLTVVPLLNYTHHTKYSLPVKPSPNLVDDKAINLYPSTCFFEGTNATEGRGTDWPFEVYGSPYQKNSNFTFTPKPNFGSKSPRYNGELCYGEKLTDAPYLSEINLEWLINAYKNNTKNPFWIKNGGSLWIDKLAGTDQLRLQIEKGLSAKDIKASWQSDLTKFKEIRAKYLLYKD